MIWRYPVCTTIEYSYKPASNTTTVTVEPQSSKVAVPTKTPEQMQQEAEQKGWLKIWHEFTWWYPWYRLHIKLTFNGATIHVAFNPVLPGGEKTKFSGLDNILTPLPYVEMSSPSETSKVIESIVSGTVLGLIGLAATAVAAGNIPALPATIAAMITYGAVAGGLIYQAVQLYYSSETGAHVKALAKLGSLFVTFAGAAVAVTLSFSAMMIFKTIIVTILAAFLANLINPSTLETALTSVCYSMWTGLCLGLALLRIPNPSLSNVYFRPAFLITNLLFVITTLSFLLVLKP